MVLKEILVMILDNMRHWVVSQIVGLDIVWMGQSAN